MEDLSLQVRCTVLSVSLDKTNFLGDTKMLTLKNKITRAIVLGLLALSLVGTPLIVSTNTAFAGAGDPGGGHTGG